MQQNAYWFPVKKDPNIRNEWRGKRGYFTQISVHEYVPIFQVVGKGIGERPNKGDLVLITYNSFLENGNAVEQRQELLFVIGMDQTLEGGDLFHFFTGLIQLILQRIA